MKWTWIFAGMGRFFAVTILGFGLVFGLIFYHFEHRKWRIVTDGKGLWNYADEDGYIHDIGGTFGYYSKEAAVAAMNAWMKDLEFYAELHKPHKINWRIEE